MVPINRNATKMREQEKKGERAGRQGYNP